jgi:uncharacterized protein YgbK (DUF1537 family)
VVRKGADAIRAALAACAQRGERLAIVDAIDDADLVAIGAACRDAKLVTGGSGIAIGLARNFGGHAEGAASFRGVAGPGAILAGSCSAMTLQQVAHHRASQPALAGRPVLGNADFGHTNPMITFPIGGRARLEVGDQSSLVITEH